MKKTSFYYTLLFLLCFTTTNAQLPCKFRWDKVKTVNGERNFVTDTISQAFNGPCLSYAFASAIESMYMIENSTVASVTNISPAFLDIKIRPHNDKLNNYKNTLENGFKIPKRTGDNLSYHITNHFVQGINNYDKVPNFTRASTKCVLEGKSFITQSNEINDTITYRTLDNCGSLVTRIYNLSLTEVKILSKNISIEKIKETIIDHGPLVMKVKNQGRNGNLSKFRQNYPKLDLDSTQYHAYTIIGWQNSGNNTKWVLKDSWMKKAAIITTNESRLTDNEFKSLLSREEIELATVSGIRKNNSPVGSQKFSVNYGIQCNVSTVININKPLVEPDFAYINGVFFHKFSTTSSTDIDQWEWRFITNPPYGYTRSQQNSSRQSSILARPRLSGNIIMKVRAKKENQWTDWKSISLYLTNGGTIDEEY